MPRIVLRVLGEAVIEVGERTISPSATHVFALLLHIATEAPRHVSSAPLAELLFPAERPDTALHNLRQLVYRIRHLGVPLKSNAECLSIDQEDVLDLTKLQCAKRYPERRIRTMGGLTILPNYDPPTAAFSTWVEAYRDRQHRALVQSISADLGAARRSGDWEELEVLASVI